MERCALTQVPCREAIAEIVAENKNRYFLQRTYEVAMYYCHQFFKWPLIQIC